MLIPAACTSSQPVARLADAQQQAGTETGMKTSASIRWRSEPVIYNGRRYTVSFRKTGHNARVVKVGAPGRKLGTSAGDRRIVAQIATSAIRHFTCRDGQKAHVRPGSLRAQGEQWLMRVDCR